MSYSISASGSSKAAALADVAAKLDEVVKQQPIHEKDRAQAEAAAKAMIDILPDPDDTHEVGLSVSGSVGWTGTYPTDHVLTSASVSIYARLQPKTA